MRVPFFAVSFALLSALAVTAAAAAPLKPAVHGDFKEYTLALTWQPGMCGTDEGCQPDQPKMPTIGLHGLWASLPQSLIDAGVVPQQWWSRGCDYYRHSDAAPPLSAALTARLNAVMPHFKSSLLVHEYAKHVQCFAFDPTTFFTTELAMRQTVANGAFGRYLAARTGQTVAHADVVDTFDKTFGLGQSTTLQLQCGRDHQGREVLTQLWIALRADRLATFPNASAFTDTAIAQDNCPATFLVPSW
ncbi:MAG TPA: hypothetical protein VIJ12_06850 [Candidatus Baltobacteraceae bacterium]